MRHCVALLAVATACSLYAQSGEQHQQARNNPIFPLVPSVSDNFVVDSCKRLTEHINEEGVVDDEGKPHKGKEG
jgi:hypothetical protein